MAQVSQLPCDGEGVCMQCREFPAEEEKVTCAICVTPWHVTCLDVTFRPATLSSVLQWECPDCTIKVEPSDMTPSVAAAGDSTGGLVAAIRAIEGDTSLTKEEKSRRRQEIVCGRAAPAKADNKGKQSMAEDDEDDVLASLCCAFCFQPLGSPVTLLCGHNFCLRCLRKWLTQGKRTCPKCRGEIPDTIRSYARVNRKLEVAIEMIKIAKSTDPLNNETKPDKPNTRERTTKSEIVPEWESWTDRQDCIGSGIYCKHAAVINIQLKQGWQSVVLSGGHQDNQDNGDWFIFTASDGSSLGRTEGTSEHQSSNQISIESLQHSCLKGYPVCVVRSHKAKHSSFAPENGERCDGFYRIEKFWPKVREQGSALYRFLFVRCDNYPASWTSDEHGDRPRSLPDIEELKEVVDVKEREEGPSWDFEANEQNGHWKWFKPPSPASKKAEARPQRRRRRSVEAQRKSLQKKLLREFGCPLCKEVMTFPVTTPCSHNFCEECLKKAFTGKAIIMKRNSGGKTLRPKRNVLQCPDPSCSTDLANFLHDLQVNKELTIASKYLKQRAMGTEVKESNEKEAGGSKGTGGDCNVGDNQKSAGAAEGENRVLKKQKLEVVEKKVNVQFVMGNLDHQQLR